MERLENPTTEEIEHLDELTQQRAALIESSSEDKGVFGEPDLQEPELEREGSGTDSDLGLGASEEQVSEKTSLRRLEPRDLALLKRVLATTQRFKELATNEKLEFLVLAMTSACGLGGVSSAPARKALNEFGLNFTQDLDEYFLSAVWTNREGETKRRFVSPFQGAFKLDPGYAQKLAERLKEPEEFVQRRETKNQSPAIVQAQVHSDVHWKTPVASSSPPAPPTPNAKTHVAHLEPTRYALSPTEGEPPSKPKEVSPPEPSGQLPSLSIPATSKNAVPSKTAVQPKTAGSASLNPAPKLDSGPRWLFYILGAIAAGCGIFWLLK